MKQRIITGLVALGIFAAAMLGYFTPALNVVFAAIILIAVWELFHATGLLKHKALYILSTVYAVSLPFVLMLENSSFILVAETALFAFLLLVIAMRLHQTVKFSEVCTAFFLSTVFPLCFLCLLLTRYAEPLYGLYYLIAICFIAWGGDTFAYFTGRFLGKHKLAPVISPKKTIEGVVGGVAGSVLVIWVFSLSYSAVMERLGYAISVRYEIILPAAAVLSLVSVFGDLTCSLIKRQYGIKDFGTIMPGHGGVMDRFDSVLMVAPFIVFLMYVCPVVLSV